MRNSAVDSIRIGGLSDGNFSITLDVDAVNGKIDSLTAASFSAGTITLKDLNFLSEQKNFELTVLNGTNAANLVLASDLASEYNGRITTVETRNNLESAATWETAFTQTEYTLDLTRSLTVKNNNTLLFEIVKNNETAGETTSLGDTIALLNGMEDAVRMMTNSASADTYNADKNFGTTAKGEFSISGVKADQSAAVINMNEYTGFVVANEAILNLQSVIFEGNIDTDGSVLTVAGGKAVLKSVKIGNPVLVSSGTLTLLEDNVLGGLLNDGTVSLEGKNTIGAMSGSGVLINNGILILNGLTNGQIINGEGETIIDADLTTTSKIDQKITINASKSLISNADKISDAVTNNGTLVLTGGTLSQAVSGTGSVDILGDVRSDVALSNASVLSGGQLTLNADKISGAVTNSGTLVLTGGTLLKELSGNVVVSGTVRLSAGSGFSGAQIDLRDGVLDIKENMLTADTINGGTIMLDLKETASAEILITAIPVGTVNLNVSVSQVSHSSVQHYLLTSSDTGYSLTLQTSGRYTISSTPFTKEQAGTIPRFDPALWTGGGLYIIASSPAEIALSELVNHNYPVTWNEQHGISELDDDVKRLLPVSYQREIDRVNDALAGALDDSDYQRMDTILREVAVESSPAVFQTAQANAAAVMSVIDARIGENPEPLRKGRSGGGEYKSGALSVWTQGMVNTADLKGNDGFDADSAGVVAGIEKSFEGLIKVGAGYAFTKTKILTRRSRTDVDTHTGFVYGEYKPDSFYFNSALSYGQSKYDETTKLIGLKSKYKADTFSVKLMSGYAYGKFTPEAGIRYTAVFQKSYMDALGAKIRRKTVKTGTGVVGVKTTKKFQAGEGVLETVLKGALSYDFLRGGYDRAVLLADGASYIAAGKSMKRFGMEVETGLSYKLNRKTDIGLFYTGKFKKEYTDHTGTLSVNYAF